MLKDLIIKAAARKKQNRLSSAIEITDNDWNDISQKLSEIKQQIKELKAAERILRDELVELSNETSSYNAKFLFECIERSGTVNYSRLIKDHKIDIDPYRNESTTVWKLTEL